MLSSLRAAEGLAAQRERFRQGKLQEEADAAAINKRVEKDKSKFGGGEIPGSADHRSACCIGDIEASGRVCDPAAGVMAPCISSDSFEWRTYGGDETPAQIADTNCSTSSVLASSDRMRTSAPSALDLARCFAASLKAPAALS